MSAFNFDQIEEELGLVVPTVFRDFIASAEALGFPFAEEGFYEDTDAMVVGNLEMRDGFDGLWKDHFLAFETIGDSCGNYYFIKAAAKDDDEIALMSHDPPGSEGEESASSFFRYVLDGFKRGHQNFME